MKIISSQFVKSAYNISQFIQDGLFEIVLVGRSNVGKSSFINAVTNKKSMARTSSLPGRTKSANFYLVNGEFYFVDMPGYGYAKASKQEKADFSKLMGDYIKKRNTDFAVFMLVDHKIPATENDAEMYRFLKKQGITPVIVMTKADKLTQAERHRGKKEAQEVYGSDDIKTFSIKDARSAVDMREFIGELTCSISKE